MSWRRLKQRSRGRLPSHAEEGDGADMRGRAVSGCGREEGAAAGLAAVLGRAARTAGLEAGAGPRSAQGGGELGCGRELGQQKEGLRAEMKKGGGK